MFIRLLSRFVCECPPDLKFNVDVIDILIRSRLINMRDFDLHLAQVGLKLRSITRKQYLYKRLPSLLFPYFSA